ncbi:MAG: NAD(P)/FAD-dependent oxidoreductase [Cyclobacteriaceae bacterium]|nr:NAD(P)/FAD-dependent oxidoreductase [Cyclobacteriaceae bacterium]
MNRRELLQRLAYVVPAGMMFPSLLHSCAPKDPPLKPVYDGKVIIIGAGISGLHAAQIIKAQNVDVEILEATNLFGGRIKVNPDFFDFPLEQGADYIYGNNNAWYSAIEGTGISMVEIPVNPAYVMDGVPKLESELGSDIDFQNAQSFINNLINRTGPDLTLENAVVSAQIAQRAHHVVEGVVATPKGATYDSISVKGITENLNLWNDGDGRYFSQNQTLVQIVGNIYSNILSLVKFNTPITNIDYNDPTKIVLTDGNGDSHECTRVIVTAPLAVLKAGDINFSPTLPVGTTAAWNRVGMAGGIKVALSFFVNFWDKQVSSIYTQGYAREYYAAGMGRSNSNKVLTATIMGAQADALAGKTDEEIINLLLVDLDAIYDGQASHQFNAEDSYVFDWSKQPYTKGAVSYPIVSGTGAAKTMATPIEDRIFWAGEATAFNGNNGTVQGGIESAERAVAELFEIILDL